MNRTHHHTINSTRRLTPEAYAVLEASPDYRVLRRLRPREPVEGYDATETRLGLLVDVETTGLDPDLDEIIELAMVPFRYALDGMIVEVQEPFDRLREPTKLISPEITMLTGISDTMVSGKSIDPEEVAAFAAPAAVVIAHNAAFDRHFLERFSPVFSTSLGPVPCRRSTGRLRGSKAPSSPTSRWP
ncbi:exonuclease domain-containing protein [Acetobacter ghanensis]|uniref:exonuclease domain-containing protein n=1 Tax=Acetobacter ghanensis TaxID=431306 RepID=UPI003D3590A6